MQKVTKKHGILKFTAAAIAIAGFFASAQASATLINFESAGSLGDNAAISPTQTFPFGQTGANVTFVGGADPNSQTNTGVYLEHSGNAVSGKNGFLNTHNGSGKNQVDNHDTARPCFPTGCSAHSYPAGEPGLGNWFLRTGGLGNKSNELGTGDTFLTINYGTATLAASGQIWDIDADGNGFEQWTVYAYSGSTLVATDVSPTGISQNNALSLDGLPWDFSLNPGGGQTFDSIALVFTGAKKKSDIGLAFDNFNATQAQIQQVPEPSALWLFALGLGMLGSTLVIRRRKSHV